MYSRAYHSTYCPTLAANGVPTELFVSSYVALMLDNVSTVLGTVTPSATLALL